MTIASNGIPSAAQRARHALKRIALLGLVCALCSCGGGPATPAAVVQADPPSQAVTPPDSFTITSDTGAIKEANYLAATRSSGCIVLRAGIASSLTDPEFRTVARIDILTPQAVVPGTSYSLAPLPAEGPVFPGAFYLFNGEQSTLVHTVDGTITFTSVGTGSGDRISGTFTATVQDGYGLPPSSPAYTIAGTFRFTLDTAGPVPPAE
ncbi:hypothetical protein L4X63_12735 [Geomonas sp. Red32]|uniref:hypothetical protein n=1 Tax=Geomonas sp. Red32 TaxID=2912856 RepID=UPI00202D07A0|nr:hypothetical protein [Geomonas sp. Red32]MCM0082457.1 hypothetical protein [Geomonas sp. Red32]